MNEPHDDDFLLVTATWDFVIDVNKQISSFEI